MPISRSDFDAGELSVEGMLVAFLRDNQDLAFTTIELIEALDAQGVQTRDDELVDALMRLESRERIESKEVAGTRYYCYKRSLDFRPPQR